MPTAFNATAVSASIEPWGWLTAFGTAESEAGEGPYLLLQRSSNPSQQDIQLGHDAPYVEVSSQELAWYGHISKVELRRDRLLLLVSPSAAGPHSRCCPIQVTFSIGEERFLALKQNLENTFQGLAFNEAGT